MAGSNPRITPEISPEGALRALQFLVELSDALGSKRTLPELVRAFAQCLDPIVEDRYVGLSLLSEDGKRFEVAALDFPGNRSLPNETLAYPTAHAPAAAALDSEKLLYISDLRHAPFDSYGIRWLLENELMSACWVPLVRRERDLGVLTLASKSVDGFSAEQRAILGMVGNTVAIAVDNIVALEEIRQLRDRLQNEKSYLENELRSNISSGLMIGDSPSWRQVLQQIDLIAPADATVLILGETGTGKELVARAIHDRSARAAKPFIKVNCAAMPAGLLESELFGHERGAFTGAVTRQVGRFDLADGGTLLLDEIGDIPLDLQPKLLRVLQEGELEPLGSSRTRKVDVRVLASTNRDLAEMVSSREFRADLFYRLNVFPIVLPTLQERVSDIPLLARHFVEKHSRRLHRSPLKFDAKTLQVLQAYPWPGNVRELENIVERALLLSSGEYVTLPHLPVVAPEMTTDTPEKLEDYDRSAILHALRESKGRISGSDGAAARLGIKRTTLNSKMKKLGITRFDY